MYLCVCVVTNLNICCFVFKIQCCVRQGDREYEYRVWRLEWVNTQQVLCVTLLTGSAVFSKVKPFVGECLKKRKKKTKKKNKENTLFRIIVVSIYMNMCVYVFKCLSPLNGLNKVRMNSISSQCI